jgi:hypothetical protein
MLTRTDGIPFIFLKSKTFLLYCSLIDRLERKRHRKLILNQIKELKNSTKIKSPKFVFCHILCPHPPFVFEKDGTFSKKSTWVNEKFYSRSVEFINNKIIDALSHILKNSNKKPIIILQGDHGVIKDVVFWGNKANIKPFPCNYIKQAYSILNAWYIPDEKKPPNSKTPINNFRFILDNYFGQNLGKLEEKSYMFQVKNFIPKFTDVTKYLSTSYEDKFINGDFL